MSDKIDKESVKKILERLKTFRVRYLAAPPVDPQKEDGK